MLAWLMNLGFAAGGGRAPTPPVTPVAPGGGGHRRERRGSVWEPRVELAILEAQHRRALETFEAQEAALKKQIVRKAPVVQQERVREAIARLGSARKQAQTALDAVLARTIELDREEAEQQVAKTLRELEAASALAAREHKARQAAEVERRVAREMAVVEAARVETVRMAAAARKAAELTARKREEEAVAIVLWMAMFDE